MNNKKRRKKILRKLKNSIIFLLFLILFFYSVNTNIIFKPFLMYQGTNKLEIICKEWINKRFTSPFITKKSIQGIHPGLIDSSISNFKIERKFFLIWNVFIQEKANNQYILINNQIRVIDEELNLVDAEINQEEIKKQISILLKIEILENVPLKKSDQKNSELTTEIDLFHHYQKEIKPFILYLYRTDSSLGPKISLIQLFPKEGLRFFLFNNIYWVGNRKDYSQIESNIEKCQAYLEKKDKSRSYNEFDLRYENQIICRNNQ